MTENKDRFEVRTVGEMREKYYSPDERPPEIHLTASAVPERLRVLIPLAEKWGISDDILRVDAAKKSPGEIKELQKTVAAFDDLLDEWLAGPEARNPNPSSEYLAFTHMRMAADGC
jgi:hypothetical protein